MKEQTISNLKKLKSFHNGSYGADIERAIQALEQQPCEDCISRDEVIEALRTWIQYGHLPNGDYVPLDYLSNPEEYVAFVRFEDAETCINEMPSVTPTRTKGKWIQTKDECDGVNFYDFSFECTKCGKEQSFKSNYCPNCGAYMRESGDEE